MTEILKHLGSKGTEYSDQYNPALLEAIDRKSNRDLYNINEDKLPFAGFDVWNCYEVSTLTKNSLPVTCHLKICYPSNSKYIVESKSLKLYLNSFNMTKSDDIQIDVTLRRLTTKVINDLSNLLQCKVEAEFHKSILGHNSSIFSTMTYEPQFVTLETISILTFESHPGRPLNTDTSLLVSKEFTKFNEDPEILIGNFTPFKTHSYSLHSSLLRSNCKVTHQPDWGDVYIKIESKYELDLYSVLEYIISFRKENHFHEEICECIYKRLFDKFSPSKLMVCCLYTRRGGIDINPIRVSDISLLEPNLIDVSKLVPKTLRQ
jgi:7-cyano-7-deazaguanine reductase